MNATTIHHDIHIGLTSISHANAAPRFFHIAAKQSAVIMIKSGYIESESRKIIILEFSYSTHAIVQTGARASSTRIREFNATIFFQIYGIFTRQRLRKARLIYVTCIFNSIPTSSVIISRPIIIGINIANEIPQIREQCTLFFNIKFTVLGRIDT